MRIGNVVIGFELKPKSTSKQIQINESIGDLVFDLEDRYCIIIGSETEFLFKTKELAEKQFEKEQTEHLVYNP